MCVREEEGEGCEGNRKERDVRRERQKGGEEYEEGRVCEKGGVCGEKKIY